MKIVTNIEIFIGIGFGLLCALSVVQEGHDVPAATAPMAEARDKAAPEMPVVLVSAKRNTHAGNQSEALAHK
jgi:hypothetical protein